MSKRTKIKIGVISFLVLASIVFGGTVYAKNTRKSIEAEYQKQFKEVVAISLFRQQFGAAPVIQGKQLLKEVDVIYWTDTDNESLRAASLHAALRIGDIWLEVPRQFINIRAGN